MSTRIIHATEDHRGPPGPTGPYRPTPISDVVPIRWSEGAVDGGNRARPMPQHLSITRAAAWLHCGKADPPRRGGRPNPSLSTAAVYRHGGLTRPAGSTQPPTPQHTQVRRHGRRGIDKGIFPGLRDPLGSLIDFIPPLPPLKSQPMFIARAVPRLLLSANVAHMHLYTW